MKITCTRASLAGLAPCRVEPDVERAECVVDSCGEPAEYAGAYRLGPRKIILQFCERHFDETSDDALDHEERPPVVAEGLPGSSVA